MNPAGTDKCVEQDKKINKNNFKRHLNVIVDRMSLSPVGGLFRNQEALKNACL